MYQKMKKQINNSTKFFMIAIQLSLLILFNYTNEFEVTGFKDRVMGQGLLYGVDISQRVNYFYFRLFLLIPIITIIIIYVLNKILKNQDKKTIKFMNLIAILGIINNFIAFINILQDSSTMILSTLVLANINIVIILNILYQKILKKQHDFRDTKWVVLAAIPMAFLLTIFLHKLKINFRLYEININWIICYLIGAVFLSIIIRFKKINKEVLKKSYIAFLTAPLLEYIYIELYNILNQHNIFLPYKGKIIVAIYAICTIITIIYYLVNKKKNIKFKYEKYYYSILILAFTFMYASISMVTTNVTTDFFEQSNHGTAIYELFKYGKIPLIETFDAHMLSNEIFEIIFVVLNQDIIGGIFNLYSSYKIILLAILFYFILKNIFSKDTAFFTTIFFILTMDESLKLYYIAFLPILTLINAYKKRKFSSYLLYWISLAFVCLWQLDIGFSISIATVITLVYLLIKNRKNIHIKNVLIPFAIVIITFGIIFLLVCGIKHINFITRIIEFLKISMSNINWSYYDIGNTTELSYIYAYYALPLFMVGTLINIVYQNRNKKIISSTNIILIVLGIFYMSNLQRGMIRHSLLEGTTVYVLNFSYIYIAILLSKYFKKNIQVFLVTYLIILLFGSLFTTKNIKIYSNIFETATNKYMSFALQDEVYTEKAERIQLSDIMKNEYSSIKEILNEILKEDETFLDLSNQTLLYALVEKEKPVYVNQTPGLLSGELTQQLFIKEVEEYSKKSTVILKAKDKLLSYKLDEIPNDYRYYLLAEYTYKNYIPVAYVNGYEIWLKKENYEEKLNKMKQISNINIEFITEEKYFSENKNSYNLKRIPFIWGEYDIKKSEQSKIQELISDLDINQSDKKIKMNTNDINKENGNYLKFKIYSSIESSVKVRLYHDNEYLGEYIFNTKAGVYDYTIRISTMHAWYTGDVNEIEISSESNIKLMNLSIEEANTIK